MKAITLSATFDGQQIRLEEDFPLRKDARLLVTVLPDEPRDEIAFREFWRQLGSRSLARAYDANEPDYTLDMVREPNSKYEARRRGARGAAAGRRPTQAPSGPPAGTSSSFRRLALLRDFIPNPAPRRRVR